LINSQPQNEKVTWIENILNSISEKQNILFQDQDFVFLPDIDWNKKDINRLHFLAIVKDRNIKSIRDLTSKSIQLL
jgi:m7GpppX diphosphatase